MLDQTQMPARQEVGARCHVPLRDKYLNKKWPWIPACAGMTSIIDLWVKNSPMEEGPG